MSDKKGWNRQKTCGMCARVTHEDIKRGYCPVTASNISRNRPAGMCKYFVYDEDFGSDGRPRRRANVR